MKPAKAAETYTGPYRAEVIRVVDSDTIKVRAAIWPDLESVISVRVRGVDTPEKFQPKCPEEKTLALKASAYVESLLPEGTKVTITNIGDGKYAGRVVGDILIDGNSLADRLIEQGYAYRYDGGTKQSWCEGLAEQALREASK